MRTELSNQTDEIGLLSRGTEVTVFEIKHGWTKIEYEGQTGWIASHYLYELPAKSVTVITNGVRLRINLGTNSAIIGHAEFGKTF